MFTWKTYVHLDNLLVFTWKTLCLFGKLMLTWNTYVYLYNLCSLEKRPPKRTRRSCVIIDIT